MTSAAAGRLRTDVALALGADLAGIVAGRVYKVNALEIFEITAHTSQLHNTRQHTTDPSADFR